MQKSKRPKRAARDSTTTSNVWRITFDALNLPIFVHDQNLCIVRANRAYAERANLSFEEMLGRPYWEVFPKGKGPMLGCGQIHDGPAKTGPPEEGREDVCTLETGEVLRSTTFAIRDDEGVYLYSIHILEDVTEQCRAEAERHRLSEALHQSGGAILLLDLNGRITYINPAFSRLFGYAMDELAGKPISVLAPPPDQDVAPPQDKITESVREHQHWIGEAVRRAKDGSLIPVHLTAAAIRDSSGTLIGYVGIYVDLRVIKEVESGSQTLREAIEDLSTELDLDTLGKKALTTALTLTSADVGAVPLLNETDGMLYHHWHMGFPSKVVKKLKRPFRPDEGLTSAVMGAGRSQIAPNYPEYEHALTEYVALGVQSVLAVPIEVAGKIRGALVVASLGHPHAFNEAHIPVLEAIARQIGIAIQRQQLMDQVQASEARFRALVETTSDWVWEVDRDIVYTYASPKVKELLGYEPEEVIGKTPFDLMPPDEAQRISKLFQSVVKAREPFAGLENTNRHKDGRLVVLETSGVPFFDAQGNLTGYRGIDRDITERKRSEEALRESEEKYRAIFKEARDGIVLLNSETGEVVDCNPEFERQTGRTRAQLKNIKIWELRPPEAVAAAKKKFQEIKEKGVGGANDSYFQKPNGEIVPVEFLARVVKIHGKDHIQSVTRDITERKQSIKRLEKALTDTIQAIARTVEKRDPYTAGHQQRVAKLAVAIAGEMGFPEEQLKGILFGSMIHDIGKIYIPAEILNRPGKLSPAEFEIIKTHPQVGYDIIRNVEFPWPVEVMLLQHHERLDGSGYPQALTKNDIAPEARILAVADVVEAMSSHRPYRPGLGIDFALEEIRKHRGKLYDPDAVDACISLFKTRQFNFQ